MPKITSVRFSRLAERGVASLEYLIVFSVAFLGVATALVLLGPELVRRYEWLRLWALLPIP